ncbi:50S ribosomal protein L28 [Alkaliphilus pronyensis]|uniref:Large ribosomal subunit protein bL28 n=1 Tax=Alkaliphilus pronyensis TaxID=1482732 RepID=A0A6I0F8U3_9FIRM|nr:50S ribosomal protein L28 [Alkaliphilus pronyensis]KAB3535224.1 50S ribosomal protein L28 [Alkaliphilus pronyensis]
MAKVCDVCGKGKVFGNQVSHSNRHSKRTWSPNLRRVRAIINGTPKRVSVCTRCLRTGKVERAL